MQSVGGEGQPIWAAQGQGDDSLGPGVRAWRLGRASAVTSPGLSQRNRLAITGDHADAVSLARQVLHVVGPSYRPFGEATLIGALVQQLPGLVPVHEFFWMDSAVRPAAIAADVEWLGARQEMETALLFDRFFPDSYAQPGRSGVRRWAGVLGNLGSPAEPRPLAVAADAWSATGCGFLAGVFTHPDARRRGLAQNVCSFVVDDLVRRYGRAALMVDSDNAPAIAAYERLGMTKRRFGAARIARQ